MDHKEFDQKFDAGEDISEQIDWTSARRPNMEKLIKDAITIKWMTVVVLVSMFVLLIKEFSK